MSWSKMIINMVTRTINFKYQIEKKKNHELNQFHQISHFTNEDFGAEAGT